MTVSLPQIAGISSRSPEGVGTRGHAVLAHLWLRAHKSLHNRYLGEHQRQREEIGYMTSQTDSFSQNTDQTMK